MKHPFLIVAMLITTSAYAAETLTSPCTMTGMVQTIEKVEKSAWADGAPSPFSTVEIVVGFKNGTRAKTCTEPAPQKYKLCSPTPVKVGDAIYAVEAMTDKQNATCLFDIAVITPPEVLKK